MHEISIAQSLVELACEQLAGAGSGRVAVVRIRVGAMAGVVADAMHFAFAAVTAGTPLDGARLEIESVPLVIWCAACSAERELPTTSRLRCPVCEQRATRIVRGQELDLHSLQLADAD